MKIIVSVLLLIIQLSAASISDDAVKCGSLGVMSTDNLPEGLTSADVRTCADHPIGNRRSGVQSLAPMSNTDLAESAINAFYLASRIIKLGACYYEAPYGCSDGYCWSGCDGTRASGKWCWLAFNDGVGDWLRCSTYTQCGPNVGNSGCGRNCKEGSKACGCSCDH